MILDFISDLFAKCVLNYIQSNELQFSVAKTITENIPRETAQFTYYVVSRDRKVCSLVCRLVTIFLRKYSVSETEYRYPKSNKEFKS